MLSRTGSSEDLPPPPPPPERRKSFLGRIFSRTPDTYREVESEPPVTAKPIPPAPSGSDLSHHFIVIRDGRGQASTIIDRSEGTPYDVVGESMEGITVTGIPCDGSSSDPEILVEYEEGRTE